MLIKIFVRTFPSTEDCELFESILETRWPKLLQQVKGVRFRAIKNSKKGTFIPLSKTYIEPINRTLDISKGRVTII